MGLGCVWWVEQTYVAERSISPSTGVERWVVADARTYDLHGEACAFLAGLRSKGRSPNTERVYAGRLALYLNYCTQRRIEWSRPSFMALSGLQQWLVTTPLPARSRRSSTTAAPRYRSQGTANAVMTAVTDFLRFGALHGWVPAQTAGLLSEPKFLRYLPAGYDAGERGQWRQVQVSAFRFQVSEPGYEDLSPEQIRRMIADTPRARDRFLIALLAATSLRIGEALGLRQEDLHFLASSRSLGCPVQGPHLHVRRRTDNPNRALAKSRHPRCLPVTPDIVSLYTDYQYERTPVAAAAETGMVFVNLFRPPLGRAMTYPNAKTSSTVWPGAPGIRRGRTCCATPRPPTGCAREWTGTWCKSCWVTPRRCPWTATDTSMSPRPGRLSTGPRHGGRTSEHRYRARDRTGGADEGHEEVVGEVAACPHRSRVAAGGVGQRQMAVHRRSRQPAYLVLPVPHPLLRHDRARSGDVLHVLLGPAQKERPAAGGVRRHLHPQPFQIPASGGRRAVHAHP